VRGFQTTALRKLPAPQEGNDAGLVGLSDVESIDVELSNKLADELKLEGSMDEGMEIPPSIQEYLEKGPFKVPSF